MQMSLYAAVRASADPSMPAGGNQALHWQWPLYGVRLRSSTFSQRKTFSFCCCTYLDYAVNSCTRYEVGGT